MPMKANDSVYKIVTLARWQRNWINSHRSINFSGLVEMHLSNLIKDYDPDYFKKNEHFLKDRMIRRKDNLMKFVSP